MPRRFVSQFSILILDRRTDISERAAAAFIDMWAMKTDLQPAEPQLWLLAQSGSLVGMSI